MSWRRVPVFATLIVLAAVAVMVRLGFWQLDRLGQKEALLMRYAAASQLPMIDLERTLIDRNALYRRVTINCRQLAHGGEDLAGRNARGEIGWAHTVTCAKVVPDPQGIDGWGIDGVDVVIGWSNHPEHVSWMGGKITGVIAPGAGQNVRIIADPPLAGLEANAKPDPSNIPNNHLAYAVQWFLFALTALVIYAIALRKRLRE